MFCFELVFDWYYFISVWWWSTRSDKAELIRRCLEPLQCPYLYVCK
jgi:hypothetical protein